MHYIYEYVGGFYFLNIAKFGLYISGDKYYRLLLLIKVTSKSLRICFIGYIFKKKYMDS